MRSLLLLVTLALIVVVLIAVVGPTLPEGNPLRAIGDGIRDFGGTMGDGFGGGYQPITPGS